MLDWIQLTSFLWDLYQRTDCLPMELELTRLTSIQCSLTNSGCHIAKQKPIKIPIKIAAYFRVLCNTFCNECIKCKLMPLPPWGCSNTTQYNLWRCVLHHNTMQWCILECWQFAGVVDTNTSSSRQGRRTRRIFFSPTPTPPQAPTPTPTPTPTASKRRIFVSGFTLEI